MDFIPLRSRWSEKVSAPAALTSDWTSDKVETSSSESSRPSRSLISKALLPWYWRWYAVEGVPQGSKDTPNMSFVCFSSLLLVGVVACVLLAGWTGPLSSLPTENSISLASSCPVDCGVGIFILCMCPLAPLVEALPLSKSSKLTNGTPLPGPPFSLELGADKNGSW